MTNSLRYVDTTCQRIVDSREKKVLPFRVAHSIEERQALGSRLKAARELARMTHSKMPVPLLLRKATRSGKPQSRLGKRAATCLMLYGFAGWQSYTTPR
jgi:hypothetical protein